MRPVLIERTPSRIDAIDLWAISPAPSASRALASDCSLDSGVVSLVSSSARVVYAALAGDLAVAAAKFGASALSGSTAMLTEAIHSLVDSADQILLLTGQSRARKRPDRTHPFGYGMETYFWFRRCLIRLFLRGSRGLLSGRPSHSHAPTYRVPCDQPGSAGGIRIVRRLVLRRRLPRIQTGYPGTRHPLVVLH